MKSLVPLSIFIGLTGIYHYNIVHFQIYIDADQSITGILFPVFYGLWIISFVKLVITAYLFSRNNQQTIPMLKFSCIVLQLITIFWGGKCYLEMLQ
ncbi:MAG: hypothetical protein OMM_09270 [Candidatus Magnetoglobus multicellularis str. Araruama]|uniref:Uncharacterized protein n=1 Tax=Candidatus Magnetoglobus multicellularis str. Araruama TaxID=890399 RepID=A0A1V1P4J7_9BACT|nr:MAG: hypothetical protein OMM_09270 [Candidatus Magnetoglobus multicellularis str. Araruama]